ncbi:MAG: hypothetical protein ABSF12_00390 [Bryobacteraceae bacterium]|jgi:hypothetical protein
MVSLDSRVESANAQATLAPMSSSSNGTADFFAQQLASALERQRNESREGTGQDSGVRQFLAAASTEGSPPTATNEATSSSSSVTAPSTAPGTTAPGTMEQLFSGGPVSVIGAANSGAASSTGSAAPPTETEAEAYWAEQPIAVQALQNMPVGPARDALAQSLAGQGYLIDNQIMVQGWDPQTTMMLRQDYGYTSVPAYGQTGSATLPVTTAFAVGTVQTQYALLMQSEATT